jgi:nitrite reductase/ring-hydroxylating ferredoxin subunit
MEKSANKANVSPTPVQAKPAVMGHTAAMGTASKAAPMSNVETKKHAPTAHVTKIHAPLSHAPMDNSVAREIASQTHAYKFSAETGKSVNPKKASALMIHAPPSHVPKNSNAKLDSACLPVQQPFHPKPKKSPVETQELPKFLTSGALVEDVLATKATHPSRSDSSLSCSLSYSSGNAKFKAVSPTNRLFFPFLVTNPSQKHT